MIWSARGIEWIETMMRELEVTSNPNYKISFMLDYEAMISVFNDQRKVKPLGVIWGKYRKEFFKNVPFLCSTFHTPLKKIDFGVCIV